MKKTPASSRTKLAKVARKVAGSLANVDIPGWETSEAAAAWVHDLRQADEEQLRRKWEEDFKALDATRDAFKDVPTEEIERKVARASAAQQQQETAAAVGRTAAEELVAVPPAPLR